MPYNVNGETQSDIAEPVTYRGITYVPLAHLVEVLGGYVTWDNASKTASIEMGSAKLSVSDGSNSVATDSSATTLSSPAMIENNTLYVPLEFFEKVLGSQTSADGDSITLGLPTLGQ